MPTDYRSMYDRDYIGSWELPEGHDLIVTIESVKGGELNNGARKTKKPIITLAGRDKKFVCNKTNAKAIAGMYGNIVDNWKGKRIAMYVSTTRDPSTGGDTPCIRVRPTIPSSTAAPQGGSASPAATSSLPGGAAGSSIDAEALAELRAEFAKCDAGAEKAFLKLTAKVYGTALESLEKLPAADIGDAVEWIEDRKARIAAKQSEGASI